MYKLKRHTMETESIFFTENSSGNFMTESSFSDDTLQAVNNPEPGDEAEDDDKDTDEEAEEYKGDESSNDDPPLDKGVVHSPVTTLPGGVPKKS